MIIEYTTHQKVIYISIVEKEFAKEKPEDTGWGNANPLLKKVNKFQDKNWEVINFSTELAGDHSTDEIFFAYLRKKKTGN